MVDDVQAWINEMNAVFGERKKMETFKVKVKDVYEAIEKNGFDLLRGSWFKYDDEGNFIIGGCVLGQAAINLGAWQPEETNDDFDDSLVGQLNRFPIVDGNWALAKETRIEESIIGVGQQIVYWNDKELATGGYYLPTYEDVAKMAKDCLEPYFDQEIELLKQEWNVANAV